MASSESALSRHFKRHMLAYILSIAFLTIGLVFGTLATGKLTPEQKTNLVTYLETYINGFKDTTTTSKTMLFHSLITQGKTLGIAYLLGLTVIGAPGVLALIFIKGFLIGFTVGFLAREYLLRGVVLSLAAVVPHSLVVIPALVMLSVLALSFAWGTIRGPGIGIAPVYKRFPRYTALSIAVGVVLAGSSLIEAYVTPVFIGLVSKYL